MMRQVPQSNHRVVIAIITAMWITLLIAVGAYVEHWAFAKVGSNKLVHGVEAASLASARAVSIYANNAITALE
jgi:hypothetical protein